MFSRLLKNYQKGGIHWRPNSSMMKPCWRFRVIWRMDWNISGCVLFLATFSLLYHLDWSTIDTALLSLIVRRWRHWRVFCAANDKRNVPWQYARCRVWHGQFRWVGRNLKNTKKQTFSDHTYKTHLWYCHHRWATVARVLIRGSNAHPELALSHKRVCSLFL